MIEIMETFMFLKSMRWTAIMMMMMVRVSHMRVKKMMILVMLVMVQMVMVPKMRMMSHRW